MEYKNLPSRQYKALDKDIFNNTYKWFRFKVFLFWLTFILLCFIAKYIFHINYGYFYACTFFFLLIDRVFVNEVCLLQKFSDPSRAIVVCCCGCPCRGWDLLMIHTPLLFALCDQFIVENILICISSCIALFSFLGWEKEKYYLVEVRRKCKSPCNLNLCREHLH